MLLALHRRQLFPELIFSDQPGIRVVRHLSFWTIFLAIHLIPGPSLSDRFEGSHVLFYCLAIPFYYLSCYLTDKMVLSAKGIAGFVILPALLILIAHLSLTLITALQIYFPVFQQPTPAQLALYSFSAHSHITGFLQVLEYVILALSFIFAPMSAFVFKIIKEVYLSQKTAALIQTDEPLNKADKVVTDPGDHLTLSALKAVTRNIPAQAENVRAVFDSTTDIMDYRLNETKKKYIPLQSELDVIEKLLHLHHSRFSDTFSSNINIQGKILANHKLPTMLLFSLVDYGLALIVENNYEKSVVSVDVLIDGPLLHFKFTQAITAPGMSAATIKAQWQEHIETLTDYASCYFLKGFKIRMDHQDNTLTVAVIMPVL
ncbi:hypothetical protein DSL64_21595 [Dyadobacter luteus]|uniref:Histidine kinase n=1 Tax=Dyadobacter luteus TaxID=2259619 RepID=A0A3D8Y6A1_9BACT|nr:hypothetical protein [Dyadobacter luteus]REA58205.1 hypothetical protein DSL64_21595 [Dyadobacter luteus]